MGIDPKNYFLQKYVQFIMYKDKPIKIPILEDILTVTITNIAGEM